MIKYIMDRLRERSTYLGIVALLGVFGIQLLPEQKDAIMQACMALVGVVGVFSKDRK